MPDTYPQLMTADNGEYSAIARGHNLDADLIASIELAMIGRPADDERTKTEEVFFDYGTIVNCDDELGWSGCENSGREHGHWTEVLPNTYESTWYTIISHEEVDED